jgi:hypothetical protein
MRAYWREGLGQEAKSMPLLAYFGTIGALLTALLVFVNFLLQPPGSKKSQAAVAAAEAKLPQPRPTNRIAEYTAGVTRVAPSAEPRYGPPPAVPAADVQDSALEQATSIPLQPAPEQQSSTSGPERKSLQRPKAKVKSAKARSRARNAHAGWSPDGRRPAYYDPAYFGRGYNAYARERSSWPFSTAQGTLGPH